MKILDKFLHIFLGLTFLPDRVRAWLFGSGTRFFEAFNVLFLVATGFVVVVDGGGMFRLPPYHVFWSAFGQAAPFIIGGALLSCAIGMLCGMLIQHTCQRTFPSGFAMIASGAVYGLLGAGFMGAYPPFSTAMSVYPVLALCCWIAGEHLIYLDRLREHEEGAH